MELTANRMWAWAIAIMMAVTMMLAPLSQPAQAAQWCKHPPKKQVYADGRNWKFVKEYNNSTGHWHRYRTSANAGQTYDALCYRHFPT